MSGQYLDCGSTKYLNQLTMKHSDEWTIFKFGFSKSFKDIFFPNSLYINYIT